MILNALTDVALACTHDSDRGAADFPAIVGRLMAAGVEWYHADLLRAEKTYYLPSGVSVVVPCHALIVPAAEAFSPDGVAAAVRAVQAKTIDYAEFCTRIAAAGCVGYIVSLIGRRAIYSGRAGDAYVEPFPGTA